MKSRLLLSVLCLVTPLAFAQVSGGAPPFGDHEQAPPGQSPDFGPGRSHHHGGPMMRGGFRLGPPGRWWDDHDFAQSIGLRPEQKDKMDTIFNANKGNLMQRFQSLQQEETHMDDVSHQPQIDEATVFAAIDRVTQARAALEKAHAHMLLLLRQTMDPGQLERLEEQHR